MTRIATVQPKLFYMQIIPSLEEFVDYGLEVIAKTGDNPENYTEWLQLKYMAWQSAGWQKTVRGKDQEIKNWKTTLINTIPYRVPNKKRNLLSDRYGL